MEAPNAMLTVIISKVSEVLMATDITFMIIPLTVDQALLQGVINEFEHLDRLNPNRAGCSLANIASDNYLSFLQT